MPCTFHRIIRLSTAATPSASISAGPLSHGVGNLAFEVTFIKPEANLAWDVGTYGMDAPQADDTKTQKRRTAANLTVWKRVANKWLIAADAWSSDLPSWH